MERPTLREPGCQAINAGRPDARSAIGQADSDPEYDSSGCPHAPAARVETRRMLVQYLIA